MLLLLMMTVPTVASSINKVDISHRISNEPIDLQEMYDFFTSDAVGQGFVIQIIGQVRILI